MTQKARKRNELRDNAERESRGVVDAIDQAKSMALRVDLVGATEALRQARQGVVQTCLRYELKISNLESLVDRLQASNRLVERQLKNMNKFSNSDQNSNA